MKAFPTAVFFGCLLTAILHASFLPSDWCAGHAVPESKCTVCNPGLIGSFKASGDWCAGHGFPESVCPQCNPQTPPQTDQTPILDWCAGHAVPESKCTLCNPGLIDSFKASGDWCAEHGFPESVCPQCNPQAPPEGIPAAADWCLEHAIAESLCTKCNPGLRPQYEASGDWCAEHGFPESACPICNPQTPPPGAEKAAIEIRLVRFRSAEIEAAAGIQTQPAKRAETTAAITTTARVAFDAERVADIRALVPGIVREIHIELGQQVTKGETLFHLESTRVGELQAALREAREHVRIAQANLNRQKELHKTNIVPARQVELAEQELASAMAESESAETSLKMTGADPSQPNGRYALTAPISGSVTRRPAVLGLFAEAETSLASIVDTSVMWVFCDVPETEAHRLALGQKVQISLPSGDPQTIEGELTWIAPEVDPRSRSVTARAEVPNPHGHLRANQFAQARIQTGAPHGAVAVPREAVQRVGDLSVVFVRLEPGLYAPRVVTMFGHGHTVLVEGDLHEGDPVAVTGAVLLRTEIMPGSIGAGCCEIELPGEDH